MAPNVPPPAFDPEENPPSPARDRFRQGSADSQWCALYAAGRAGDRDAIEALCARYRPRLHTYVRQHMGQAARRWTAPDDIVDAVLYEVVRSLESFAAELDEGAFLGRLFQTARSRIKDSVRKHRRDVGESIDAAPDHPLLSPPSVGAVTRADSHRWLHELVAHLPPKFAEAVRLVGLEGLSFVEAGDQLGIGADAVRKRYERARAGLRSRLEHRRG